MDDQRIQAEKRAAIRAEKAHQKRQRDADTGADAATSHVKAAPRKRPRRQHDHRDAGMPRPEGRFIVFEERHKDFEEAAMDAYINARLRGVCRRGVSDEFFDNRLGVFVIHFHKAGLTRGQRLHRWRALIQTAHVASSRPRACVATHATPSHSLYFPLRPLPRNKPGLQTKSRLESMASVLQTTGSGPPCKLGEALNFQAL